MSRGRAVSVQPSNKIAGADVGVSFVVVVVVGSAVAVVVVVVGGGVNAPASSFSNGSSVIAPHFLHIA